MTIVEKTQVSADKTRFTLFKEGLFYKCYNEDAMVFVKMVKNYKVNSKLPTRFPTAESAHSLQCKQKLQKTPQNLPNLHNLCYLSEENRLTRLNAYT
ncbi:MAG: hypothetical protein PF448_11795 [Bacteroidales bacterium]|jgi:hypothetical protein|nr:hypothetical protein [Bacteroidales bacterium]